MNLVLLGDPVEHSRSPAIHTAALAAAGIEGSYQARKVDRSGLVTAIAEVRYGRLDGGNVTMPHKEAAFESVDRVSETALRTGAVNTLVHRQGMAFGDNTDVAGILTIWGDAGLSMKAPVLVLGSGGAAAAALVALAEHNLHIAARRAAGAAALLERTRVDGDVVEWGTGIDGAIVVNATPIGMEGEALPDATLAHASGLVDLPYGLQPTPAVSELGGHGLPVADGRDMLLAQAAVSFELWTGVVAPMDAMRRAAR
ncbi:MAG: shikimate dehydrogenase [Acidimicrobiia bacterium]|nr:MAG: shikimate dehydrogenase [Acidimicrobiia bacterium]